MSLITRCPDCGTLFNVVSDQLKVSQGWVRCGQCSQVFDAQLHLQAEPALLTPLTVLSPAPFVASMPAPLQPEQVQPAITEIESFNNLPIAESPAMTVEPDTPNTFQLADIPAVEPPVASQTLTGADKIATHDFLNDVSFVRDARRHAFWRTPVIRTALALVALLLTCLLGVQLAVQHQDAVSAMEPRLKPWLQQICPIFSCTHGSARRIEAIIIDSSSFNKRDGNGSYQLSFTLKNIGSLTVAMPALEVSLTDLQDQPVVRRVVSATQFGAANDTLAGNSEFSKTLTLQVQSDFPVSRIAGYRLLAFYP